MGQKIICPKCKKQCSGGPLSKTDERKKKPKVLQTIAKVGNKIKPIDKKVKWVKPDLPSRLQDAKYIVEHNLDLSPKGRPKVTDKIKEEEEKEIDHHVDRIKQTKNTMHEVTLEDVPARIRIKVKKKYEKENEGKESNIDN